MIFYFLEAPEGNPYARMGSSRGKNHDNPAAVRKIRCARKSAIQGRRGKVGVTLLGSLSDFSFRFNIVKFYPTPRSKCQMYTYKLTCIVVHCFFFFFWRSSHTLLSIVIYINVERKKQQTELISPDMWAYVCVNTQVTNVCITIREMIVKFLRLCKFVFFFVFFFDCPGFFSFSLVFLWRMFSLLYCPLTVRGDRKVLSLGEDFTTSLSIFSPCLH